MFYYKKTRNNTFTAKVTKERKQFSILT